MAENSRVEETIGTTITATGTVVAVVVVDKAVASNGPATNSPMHSMVMASSIHRTKVNITSIIRVCIRSRMASPISTCRRDRLRSHINSRASQYSSTMHIKMNKAIIDKGSLECRSSRS